MTEEQKDLELLKLRQAEIKLEVFDMLQVYLNMNLVELQNCGHKSLGLALESEIRDVLRKSHNLAKIHVSKYPD